MIIKSSQNHLRNRKIKNYNFVLFYSLFRVETNINKIAHNIQNETQIMNDSKISNNSKHNINTNDSIIGKKKVAIPFCKINHKNK